jgi:hypothetical protein
MCFRLESCNLSDVLFIWSVLFTSDRRDWRAWGSVSVCNLFTPLFPVHKYEILLKLIFKAQLFQFYVTSASATLVYKTQGSIEPGHRSSPSQTSSQLSLTEDVCDGVFQTRRRGENSPWRRQVT